MAKVEDVRLHDLKYGEEGVILQMIQKDDGLRETFSGSRNTLTRIVNADYSALIKKGRAVVGFVMLVYNGRTGKHEIDMGILEKYRGMGYGSQALGKLKKKLIGTDFDIDIQTKQVNVAAIKSITKNGFVLYKEDEECYYFKLPEESKKLK